jgi:hypothetical protein
MLTDKLYKFHKITVLMAFGIFKGRLQKVTRGRIEDIIVASRIALDPNYKLNDRLRLLLNGEEFSAADKGSEFDFWGKLEGLIVGIAAADSPKGKPEQVPDGMESNAARFFDSRANPLTYFQRMIMIKSGLMQLKNSSGNENLLDKTHILPYYPSHYYPSLHRLFAPNPNDVAFEYLGVQDNHHLNRLKRSLSKNEKSVGLFHDYRDKYSNTPQFVLDTSMDGLVGLTPEEVDSSEYHVVKDHFLKAGNDYRIMTRRLIASSLDLSQRTSVPLVFAIKFSRHDEYPENLFHMYLELHNHLRTMNTDWSKTHITFSSDSVYDSGFLPKNK